MCVCVCICYLVHEDYPQFVCRIMAERIRKLLNKHKPIFTVVGVVHLRTSKAHFRISDVCAGFVVPAVCLAHKWAQI